MARGAMLDPPHGLLLVVGFRAPLPAKLGRLRVRGRGSVFRVIWHKLAGWNVLRAAASKKLRAWVAEQMARMLKSGQSAPFGKWFGAPMG
jgi:hypothetical protein